MRSLNRIIEFDINRYSHNGTLFFLFSLERLPSITSWFKIKSGFNACAQAFTFCRIKYGPPLVCQTMLRLSHRSRGSRSNYNVC